MSGVDGGLHEKQTSQVNNYRTASSWSNPDYFIAEAAGSWY